MKKKLTHLSFEELIECKKKKNKEMVVGKCFHFLPSSKLLVLINFVLIREEFALHYYEELFCRKRSRTLELIKPQVNLF